MRPFFMQSINTTKVTVDKTLHGIIGIIRIANRVIIRTVAITATAATRISRTTIIITIHVIVPLFENIEYAKTRSYSVQFMRQRGIK